MKASKRILKWVSPWVALLHKGKLSKSLRIHRGRRCAISLTSMPRRDTPIEAAAQNNVPNICLLEISERASSGLPIRHLSRYLRGAGGRCHAMRH